ncbi:MAG: acetyl-CoA C-acetyltransferase [Chloroflexi bacterium]|nr:acetyl-CoA C-acetyltransferase [Chloroflexota bacterium]
MTSQPTPVILAATRTPIGKFGGAFQQTPATILGGHAIRAAVNQAGIPADEVDEVIMGQVITAGAGQAPARQASIYGGLPSSVGAVTLNKVCGSSLKAVMTAASFIRAGEGRLYVAGGMENMNMGPYLLAKARFGYRLGNEQIIDATVHDGLMDPFHEQHMGLSAEWIAETFDISRQAQDEFALESHHRAIVATDSGRFQQEITPITISSRRQQQEIIHDESVRRDTSLPKLAALKPAFKAHGTVTAGNAPAITDGAAALVLSSAHYAQERHLPVWARIVSYSYAAVEPLEVFTAPPLAIRKALHLAGWSLDDVDLFEINEAFAAQILHNMRALGLAADKVNVHGGAIALGHPLGASGARVLTTLLHALHTYGKSRGVAALCLGGGEAVALTVEMQAA